MQRSKLQKAEDGLRKLWGNDEHYGIPEEYRTPELTLHRAQEYRALCELVSRSPLRLSQLWTLTPCFIPTAFRTHKRNFSKAVELAKQAILADWKNTNFETYEKEMRGKVLKRPASNRTGDRRPTSAGPKDKKRRETLWEEVNDAEDITFVSEGESNSVAYSVEQDCSDTGDINPHESAADRISVVIAGSEVAEDVYDRSPEIGDHPNTPLQNKNPLQLLRELMAMNSYRSEEEAEELKQTEQQLDGLRDCYAQLKEKLQNKNQEIDHLDKKRVKLQEKSQVNSDLLKKLEQLCEALVTRNAGDGGFGF